MPITVDLMKRPTRQPRSSPNIPEPFDEEIYHRSWAFQFAGQSHNVAFVPALIELLPNRSWNGQTTTTTVDGRAVETRHTVGEDALTALRRLTFQDFASDPQPWREWWASNRNTDWRAELTRYVEGVMPKLAAAEPWVMNEWMGKLEDADDPAVLPFLTGYFRHPRFDISQVGPNTSSGGGGTPPALILLLNLASQGSGEARQLLHECSVKSDYPLAIECPRIEAVFDRQKGVERLRWLLSRQTYRYWAADALVQLGDSQGIPALIDELDGAGGLGAEPRVPRPAAVHATGYSLRREGAGCGTQDCGRRVASMVAEARTTFTVKTRAARIDIDCCRM